MAKVGIRHVTYGLWKADDTYEDGARLGATAGFSGTPNVSDVSDYGDNREVGTDRSTTGGTLSLEQADLTNPEQAVLLGHEVDENDVLIASAADEAPYVGIGAIGQSIRHGVKKWVGKLYCKVKFGEPNDENTTKQETLAFNHTTIEGKIVVQENGNWKREKEFDKLEYAEYWLDRNLAAIEPIYLEESVKDKDGNGIIVKLADESEASMLAKIEYGTH